LVDEENKLRFPNPGGRIKYATRQATLGLLLYPVAYSVIVLPVSVARWSQFTHHNVPSAVTFFTDPIFSLSGVINVILFLVLRPELLLFPRPEELVKEDMEIASQNTGPVIRSNTTAFQHSPEQSVGDEGFGDGARPIHVSPRRISDGI